MQHGSDVLIGWGLAVAVCVSLLMKVGASGTAIFVAMTVTNKRKAW